MFWSKSGDVLIAEYSRSEATPEGEPGLKNLTATLNRLEQVMKFFAVSCPAIGMLICSLFQPTLLMIPSRCAIPLDAEQA